MLLNKYERYAVIAKDSHAEELLYKVERNFKNFTELQERCFGYLTQLVSDLTLPMDQERFRQLDKSFAKLLPYAGKFETLACNQELAFATFMKRV